MLQSLLDERTALEAKLEEVRALYRAEADARQSYNLNQQIYHMENYSWFLLQRMKAYK